MFKTQDKFYSEKPIFIFEAWEVDIIGENLKPAIKSIEKKIERVRNNPKNEGQVHFIEEVRDLKVQKQYIEELLAEIDKTK